MLSFTKYVCTLLLAFLPVKKCSFFLALLHKIHMDLHRVTAYISYYYIKYIYNV